jgi:hypothetical protein
MRRQALILGIPLGTALVAASVMGMRSAARSYSSTDSRGSRVSRSATAPAPVEALNYAIQDRFHNSRGFGMARMPTVPEHLHYFNPETPAEKSAVDELQGWAVGFYLGGRRLLNPPLSESEWVDDHRAVQQAARPRPRRAISEPLVITGMITPAGLPKPWQLQEIGRKALEAAATSDRYEASLGRWSVDVRPIRASRAACLECHNPRDDAALRIGDALGVAIYVYASERK